MSTRAVIYARISESKADHDSLATQEEDLRGLAVREGYELVGLYGDDGISAYSGKPRPGWLRLKDDLKAGQFDVVLAVAEDRFARSSEEKIGFQSECIRAGVTWHTISGGKVDPGVAGGALLSTITGAIAEYESGNKKERLRQRFDSETAAGRPLWGVRPFGFESSRGGEVREAEARYIREAFRIILAGGTLNAVQRLLNEAGVKTTRGNRWSYQTVRQLLLRPRNAGLLESKGVILEAAPLPSVVTRDDFESVVAILTDSSRNSNVGPKVTRHFMTGLAFCGVCAAPMRSASSRSNGRVLAIYKCSRKVNGAAVGDGLRHPTIQREILESGMPYVLFGALLFNIQAATLNEGAAARIAPLRVELAEVLRRRDVATLLLLEPDAAQGVVRNQLAVLAVRAADLAGQITELLRSNALSSVYATMHKLIDTVRAYELAAPVATPTEATVLEGLINEFYDQFIALEIEDKRALVRATVRMVINTTSSGKQRIEMLPV